MSRSWWNRDATSNFLNHLGSQQKAPAYTRAHHCLRAKQQKVDRLRWLCKAKTHRDYGTSKAQSEATRLAVRKQCPGTRGWALSSLGLKLPRWSENSWVPAPWTSEAVPLHWQAGVVVPPLQKGKLRVCSTLLRLPGKVYSGVVERRVLLVLLALHPQQGPGGCVVVCPTSPRVFCGLAGSDRRRLELPQRAGSVLGGQPELHQGGWGQRDVARLTSTLKFNLHC